MGLRLLLCQVLLATLLLQQPARAQGARGEVVLIGPGGTLVGVDGQPAGVLPLPEDQPLLLPTGTHEVVARRGALRIATRIKIQAGRRVAIRFSRDLSAAVVSPTPTVVVLGEPGAATQVRSGMPMDRALILPATSVAAALQRVGGSDCLAQRPCQVRLGQVLEADLVIHVQPAAGGLTADVVDVSIGDVAARGRLEANAPLRQVLAGLIEQATTRARGWLLVKTQPPATMYMNGERQGSGPIRRRRFVGAVEIVAAANGYVPATQRAEIKEDQETAVVLTLQRRRVHPLTALKWTSLVAGGLALGAGIALFALDGQQSCERAAERRCPMELDGISTGLGPTIGGGVGLALSALFFGLDHRRARREHAAEEQALGIRF